MKREEGKRREEKGREGKNNMEDDRKLAFDEDPIFRRLEEVGSLAALTDKERDRYEIAWKRRQDALDYYYDV